MPTNIPEPKAGQLLWLQPWFLHMGLSACSNFSDTYPLKYQRLVSKSIPRRKVFDGVTVQKFSLAG